MANEEQLAILRQGVVAWNNWRLNSDVIQPDLQGAILSGADLEGANLEGAILIEAHLEQARLHETNLSGADLRGAVLNGAYLTGALLSATNLERAKLREVGLIATHFEWANLHGADLTKALVSRTIFADIDLSGVQGLETVTHLGPSTIGIDTLINSGGDIPEAFLRGCGVQANLIEYLPHHLQRNFLRGRVSTYRELELLHRC